MKLNLSKGKYWLLLSICLMQNSCYFGEKPVYSLNVSLNHNQPCFSIPANKQFKDQYIAVVTVSDGNQLIWQKEYHADEMPPATVECISMPENLVTSGRYEVWFSTFIKQSHSDNNQLYRARFSLTHQNGEVTLLPVMTP